MISYTVHIVALIRWLCDAADVLHLLSPSCKMSEYNHVGGRDGNSIKTKLTLSNHCCKRARTRTYNICPRRFSLKYLATSQLASLALYSLSSSSIGLWAGVRNYTQLKWDEGCYLRFVLWKCNHGLPSHSPTFQLAPSRLFEFYSGDRRIRAVRGLLVKPTPLLFKIWD